MEIETIERQEVASLSTVEKKFCVKDLVWSKEEWPMINYNDFEQGDDIPVVSLSTVMNREKGEEYEKVCTDMVHACEKWGFFKLTDHGVESEIIKRMVGRCNELFDLPMDQKMKGARSTSLPLGYCASNPDYGRNLPWAEIIQLLQSPQQVVNFATKVYDDHPKPLSDAIMDYMNALDGLGMVIFEMLAHGLGLPDDFFTKNMDKKDETMIRINRYPPCPLPEKCLGLGSHSDPHTLTILLQDEVGGLQVQKSDNTWVGIRPIPNSFVINIGDTLEDISLEGTKFKMNGSNCRHVSINKEFWACVKWFPRNNYNKGRSGLLKEAWTNGRLKSVVHRAVVNREKKRLSIAYFFSPRGDAVIECHPKLVGDDQVNPRKYKPFTWGDFRKELLIQKRVLGKTALNRYLISS